MRRAFLLALLLAPAAPARAWRMFGEPSDKKIRPVQALNDAGKSAEVVAALTPEFLQTLRGTDLRQAYVLMGDNLIHLGRGDEALGYYQVGVSLFPQNVDLLTRQALLLHKNGLDEQARPLYERALTYDPRNWGAHLGLAEIDQKFGFYDRAADHYEIALEALDSRADVWREYAENLIAMNEVKTAELALRKALELEPKSAESHVLLAFVRRAQGDFDEAAAQLDLAAGLGAGAGARRAKALFLLEAGKPDAAAAEAAELLKTVPDDGAALWVSARARLLRGDDVGASRALAAIRAEDGRNAFAALAARSLERGIAADRARRGDERRR